MEKFTAIYARVSSKRQDTQSQEPDLRRWAEAQGGESRWYRDTFTGRTMDRPGFRRLVQDIAMGRVDTLVVWRLDRLGRTAKGLTAFFDDLIQRRVNLVSLRDGLDLATPAGRLMANVLASVAAYETEVRAERILVGQSAARERGVHWGGSKAGRRISVTADQVAEIRRLEDEGKGVSAIARTTGLSRPTVYRIERERAAEARGDSALATVNSP